MVRRRAAEQTLGQRVKVWSVRALLNLLILALLGAAFYGIYLATEYTVTLQVQRVLKGLGGGGFVGPRNHISKGEAL